MVRWSRSFEKLAPAGKNRVSPGQCGHCDFILSLPDHHNGWLLPIHYELLVDPNNVSHFIVEYWGHRPWYLQEYFWVSHIQFFCLSIFVFIQSPSPPPRHWFLCYLFHYTGLKNARRARNFCNDNLWSQKWASLVAQMVKNPPQMWEMWIRSLGQEDLLEKSMATYSSILA